MSPLSVGPDSIVFSREQPILGLLTVGYIEHESFRIQNSILIIPYSGTPSSSRMIR